MAVMGASVFHLPCAFVAPHAVKTDGWEMRTFAYVWQIYMDDREIIAYHWDHEGVSTGGMTRPHAHFGKELPHPRMRPEDREALGMAAAAHWPTEHVPFSALLRMATRDFGVEPIRYQGESIQESVIGAERSFSQADATLNASFSWVGRSADR